MTRSTRWVFLFPSYVYFIFLLEGTFKLGMVLLCISLPCANDEFSFCCSLHQLTMTMCSTTIMMVMKGQGNIDHAPLFQLVKKWILWEETNTCLEISWMTYSYLVSHRLAQAPQITLAQCMIQHIMREWSLPCLWIQQILYLCHMTSHWLIWTCPATLPRFLQQMKLRTGDKN